MTTISHQHYPRSQSGYQRAISGQSTGAYSTTRADHRGSAVISEKVVEHEIKVPKKVVREEVIEKVIVVPERVVTEHIVEETQKIREKIIEIAKPVYQERIVEVPEIVYVEKVVEYPEIVYQDKIREVPVTQYEERIVEVPKIIRQEKIIEVPEIEYRDVPYEKIVEVPEVREQIVIKEVPVPQYVNKPIPEYVTVEVPQDVIRHVPVPVEATTTFEYTMPQLKPKYNSVDLNLYVPRFIEVPIPAEFMDEASIAQAEQYMHQVSHLAAQTAASLCEVENLAGTIKTSGIASILQNGDYQSSLKNAWKSGKIRVNHDNAGTLSQSTASIATRSMHKSDISHRPRESRGEKSERKHHHHKHQSKHHSHKRTSEKA